MLVMMVIARVKLNDEREESLEGTEHCIYIREEKE